VSWPTVILTLGVIGLLVVAFVGGKATVNKDGVKIDTRGYLAWLLRAQEAKKPHSKFSTEIAKPQSVDPQQKLPRAIILWVDDNTLNNIFERRALASVGIYADSYTNNADALRAMHQLSYDLVISDIGREQGSETGWDLLDVIRKESSQIPFLFYTSGIDDQLRARATAKGATAVTEDPQELSRLIFQCLPFPSKGKKPKAARARAEKPGTP